MRVKRGEIWLAEMDPTRGSEQAGTRPVLILQKVKADLNMIPSFCAINSGCWIKLAYSGNLEQLVSKRSQQLRTASSLP